MATEYIGAFQEQPVSAGYKWSLAGFVAFVTLSLLTIVDFRRGFLFTKYTLTTPYFVFNPWHVLMLAVGVAGLWVCYRSLKRYEASPGSVIPAGYVKGLTFILFGLLVVDAFTYRGVPAARAVAAGKVGIGWLEAFGVTGWLRPIALTVSYLLTVWHATFLGALLAGLALTVLPRYLQSFFARTGLRGSLFGALFALPQPFCSCCAAVIAPSLVRQGASTNFSLAFVVGSPMLNLSTLILAAVLLPAPYAITRIVGGVILAVLVTYGAARLAERWRGARGSAAEVPCTPKEPHSLVQWVSRWVDRYVRAFHLEELVRDRSLDTPGAFLSAWFSVSGRIAALLVPTQLVWSVMTAAIVQVLPSAFGNNLPSVVLAAVAGTLLMVSTWTEIPVALQMIQAGYSGPAATLLLVLPPVSLPCLMLLGGSFGRFRAVALLGLAVVVVGIVVGVIFL